MLDALIGKLSSSEFLLQTTNKKSFFLSKSNCAYDVCAVNTTACSTRVPEPNYDYDRLERRRIVGIERIVIIIMDYSIISGVIIYTVICPPYYSI